MLKSSLLVLLSLAATTLAGNGPAMDYYNLKTSVISGNASKDGLYLSPYHIYAGANDVVLLPNPPNYKSFLNGTHQQFDLGDSIPWGFTLGETQNYEQWLSVNIDVGYGDAAFALIENNLISTNPEWKGWLACDWWHAAPQLFWEYDNEVVNLPSSCAKVKLAVEYLKG